jgi:hypothetical protein
MRVLRLWSPGICLTVASWNCSAQEIDATGNGKARAGSILAPAGFLEFTVPLRRRVAVNLYGFYIGEIGSSIALLEIPVRAAKFLTITPSYLYVTVPANGLNLLSQKKGGFTHADEEHQFRLAGTLKLSAGRFAISERNMYVRRFRPTGDINRYRNRLQVAHPLKIMQNSVNAFIFDEVYHDWGKGGWIRNWASVGLDVPLYKYVTFEPSFIRQDSRGLRGFNFMGLGLLFGAK